LLYACARCGFEVRLYIFLGLPLTSATFLSSTRTASFLFASMTPADAIFSAPWARRGMTLQKATLYFYLLLAWCRFFLPRRASDAAKMVCGGRAETAGGALVSGDDILLSM
jgi:hypothetical protein